MVGDAVSLTGRWARFAAALVVIGTGLALRTFGYDLGLSFFVVKYGGSVLWGAMLYLVIAALLNSGRTGVFAAAAGLIAVCVELSRLYHTPWLDMFRLTTTGALLAGPGFFALEYSGLSHRHHGGGPGGLRLPKTH